MATKTAKKATSTAKSTARKPRAKKAKKLAEASDWLEALLVAEAGGNLSDEGKVALKNVRAKAKTGSKADASTLRVAEEAVAAR